MKCITLSRGRSSVFACLLALMVAELPASVAEDIRGYDQLTEEKQEEVKNQLSRRVFRKFSPEQQKKIRQACVEFSAKVIGRKPNGRLKGVNDDGQKVILKFAGDYLNSLPPEKTPAHPRAGDLYGKIPAGAKRVSRAVRIDPAVVRWHSTGLYAAPGEVVTLEFPAAWVGKGIKVRLSGHRDRISTRKKLHRLPSPPARSFAVDRPKVKVAGAFGGAIYIDTGGKAREGKPFDVRVSNALQAPYFVLGKTKVADWKSTLRKAPAPYAELVTGRIALSFPSAWIRDLEDPTELLKYWDKVVALHDELGGMAAVRQGPERVNVDVQISVGLFHAGYPAQGPQRQCRAVVDLEKLKVRGNWGWFHEMGHEAQRRPDKAWGWNNPYTFDGSIEVTVNLFSAHAMDRLKMADRGGWSWTASATEVEKHARKALAGGKKYPQMGAGQKLAMFLQIRDKFGWAPIQKVLAGYSRDQDTDPARLPKGNQAKRDTFLVRMSLATKHNLAPFMQDLWGIPLSPESVAKVKHLPTWRPDGF